MVSRCDHNDLVSASHQHRGRHVHGFQHIPVSQGDVSAALLVYFSFPSAVDIHDRYTGAYAGREINADGHYRFGFICGHSVFSIEEILEVRLTVLYERKFLIG